MAAKQGIGGEAFLSDWKGSQPQRQATGPASGPLRTAIVLWVGGFWAWVLVKCLSDHYPTVKALWDAIALSNA